MQSLSEKTAASLELRLSEKALRTCAPPISDLIARALANPDLISFAAGLVDEDSLPVETARDLAHRVFADDRSARAALQYGATAGLKRLRELLLKHIETLESRSAHEFGVCPDDIVLTTGSQQSLYMIADVLLNPGDIVIAANPSYFVFAGTLASLGARIIGVPMDENGMQVEKIEAILHDLDRQGLLPRVKFIYCTSYYQNPTGRTLSLARRRMLLDLVQRQRERILILEDAAYRELQFEGDRLPSIKSMDSANLHTVLTQTFSKPFAPGLKLGYTLLPADLREAFLRQKGNHDFGSPNICQWMAYEAMRTNQYATQVENLRQVYQRKRDLLLAALDRYAKLPGVSWTRPGGGLYVWMTLPEGVETGPKSPFFERCAAEGVLYVPGEYAYADQASARPNELRLCYGHVASSKIEEGIKRLGRAIEFACGGGR